MPTSLIATTWPLLLGMGVLMLGAGLQGTLIGVRATLEGFPAPLTGAIMSMYYLGYLVGTSTAPKLVRQIGHIRVFATFAALASAAILVQGAYVHPIVWGLIRLVSGICFAAIYVVAESWLNARATRETRGRLLAIYMVVLYVGLGSAQYLLLAANPHGVTPFMMVSVLISLAMVPIVASAGQTPERALPRKVRYRDLYRNSPLGVVAVAVSGTITAIVFSMGPVYAHLSGLSNAGVATFMAASILSAVLTQYPVGRLSDRLDRRTVIAIACSLATLVAASVVIFSPIPHLLLLALAACFSGSALTLYSLSVSHVNDQLDAAEMVAASSALLLLNGMSAAVGPFLAGSAMAAFGPSAYFAALAALTGSLTVYDLWRKVRRRYTPADQKGPFITAHPQGMAAQIVGCADLEKGGAGVHPAGPGTALDSSGRLKALAPRSASNR